MTKRRKIAGRSEVNPLKFRARLEVLFMAVTGSDSPIGTLTWFAKSIGTDPRTVRRWCDGTYPPPDMVLILLPYMEELDAGDVFLDRADKRRYDYYEARRD